MNEEQRETWLTNQLHQIGVEVDRQHFTGDNSFSTEYTITLVPFRGMGPTFDMALVAFIEKLLPQAKDPHRDHNALVAQTERDLTHAIREVKGFLGEDVTVGKVKAYFALIYPNYSDEAIQYFIDEDKKRNV